MLLGSTAEETILLSKFTHLSLTSGNKWVYKSIVIVIDECPSWCWTYFIGALFARVGSLAKQSSNYFIILFLKHYFLLHQHFYIL